MQRKAAHQTNGKPTLHRRGGDRSHVPPPVTQSPAVSEPLNKADFCFSEIERLCVTLRLPVSTFLLGLGSTGSEIVNLILQLLIRELGSIPPAIDYFLVDAAASRPGVDKTRYFQMSVDDCGTDSKEGSREFCRHYSHLRSVIRSLVLGLFSPATSLLPPISARRATNFWVFAGCGGTSGGAVHPAITLIHDIAEDRHIEDPRIHLVVIGPEISLRDVTRKITRMQERVVRDTFANNLARFCADFKHATNLTETRPDGTTFERMTPHRIFALGHNDQSNGEAEFATVADFTQAMAHSYYLRIATQTGFDLMDRFRDIDKLNDTGRCE